MKTADRPSRAVLRGKKRPRSAPAVWRAGADPRRLAALALTELDRRRTTLDLLFEELEERHPLADRRDRDLFQAIVFGVLRYRGGIDARIARASSKPLNALDPPVLALLRAALFQVLFLDRIPAHAAVHHAVQAAKDLSPWVASFVNAVLRKAAAERAAPDDESGSSPSGLAVSSGLPPWLLSRWTDRWGEGEAAALAAALNEIPPLTLRVNTLKIRRNELIARLRPEADEVQPAALSRDGLHVRGLRPRVSETEAFRAGLFQVQDEAAQLVGALLAPRPGERVLDACAGRGGKTGHIAQMMENQGEVVALDNSARRLSFLAREMERLGVEIVSCRQADLRKTLADLLGGAFPRVLLDAPCSGLGTIRRNPDIRWSITEEDLKDHLETQSSLLASAARLVSPGGVLVYAVCSPEPEEGEEVIERFLKADPRFLIESQPADVPAEIRALRDERGFLQTWPTLKYMDGFFAVRLRHRG